MSLEDMSHVLLLLLLVCQGLCVVSPPGWSWSEEEWESGREKVEEKKEKLGEGKEKCQVEEGSGEREKQGIGKGAPKKNPLLVTPSV